MIIVWNSRTTSSICINSLTIFFDNFSRIYYLLKLKICESVIIPKLTYCYGSVLTQNSCMKFNNGIYKFGHISTKFNESGLLKLVNLRNLHVITQTDEILPSQQPTYPFKLFENFGNRDRPSRHSSHNYSLYEVFLYSAIRLYNTIPHFNEHYFLANFKKKIKELLREWCTLSSFSDESGYETD